jgi:nucleoporin NDC1
MNASVVLWSWFPIGSCGFRASLLFIISLAVFVLRVGQMHVGPRSTSSFLGTLRQISPLDIIQTFGWYALSAWWFSEVYVWSASQNANLAWINLGRCVCVQPTVFPFLLTICRLTERPTLNERPIYLHTFHLTLSGLQSVYHLYSDYDRIYIPVSSRTEESSKNRTHLVEPVFATIKKTLYRNIADSICRAGIVAAVSPVIYWLFLRQTAWSIALGFAKLFWDFPRTAAVPPGVLPSDLVSLLIRSLMSGSLLLLQWQTANLFFTVFIAQEPLKQGQPLTSGTKDPTGTLLNGLKARKDVVQTFAFWELWFISHDFADRRKAIFSDIDREGGPAWTQIFNAAVEKIKGICDRINTYKNPPRDSKASSDGAAQQHIQTLPRLTDDPKQGNIFVPSPKGSSRHEKFTETLSTTAKAYGQSPDWTPQARATAKQILNRASSAVLTPERKQKFLGVSPDVKLLPSPLPKDHASPSFPFLSQILRFPLWKVLHQSHHTRIRSIVLGTPYAQLSPIVDAIDSITLFLIASLQEDPYGKVQADVPVVVRLLSDTIFAVNDFVSTEVKKNDSDIQILDETLRNCLRELLGAFKPYLGEIGLKGNDLRLARAAASIGEGEEI